MRTYEVLFILSPQLPEEESTTLIGEFKRVAETTGATLKNEEAWGRRRLAYPIEKFNEGNYHLFVYETEGGLSELDRRMKNSDKIVRHLIVRTDLDHKRADKLAAKNPKKERVRPAPAFAPAGSSAPTSYAAPAAAPAAPAPAAPAAVAPAPVADAPVADATVPDVEPSTDTPVPAEEPQA
ncbi:MAG: ribosomal protein [Acidobacteria bacterium]|nr:ribosomal protein [Acidobacteriota bacterium]